MDKKDLKFYVAPSQEVVELNAQFALLAGSEPKPGEEDGDVKDFFEG